MKPTKAEIIEALKWCYEYRDQLQKLRVNDRWPITEVTPAPNGRDTLRVVILVQEEIVADLGKPPPYAFGVLGYLCRDGQITL